MPNPNQAAIKKYSNSSVAMTDTGTRTTPSSTTTTNTKKDNHDVYHEVKKDTTSNNTKASTSTTKSNLGTTAQRQEQIQQNSSSSSSNSINTQSIDVPRIAPPQPVKTTDSSNGVSIKSELESLGLDSAYSQSAANRAEKMDNGQIKITYYDGAMECYYDVDEKGKMKLVYGVAYDGNKNKVYEEKNGVVLKEYNPTSNSTDSSVNLTTKKASEIENIKRQMEANSKAWHTASPEEQKKLHEKNIELSKQLEDIGVKFNDKSGTWEDSAGQSIYMKKYASTNGTSSTSNQVKDTKYWEKYYGNNHIANKNKDNHDVYHQVNNETSNNSPTATTSTQVKDTKYWGKYYGTNYANNALEGNNVLTIQNATQMPTEVADELMRLFGSYGLSESDAIAAAKNAKVKNGQLVIPNNDGSTEYYYNIDKYGNMSLDNYMYNTYHNNGIINSNNQYDGNGNISKQNNFDEQGNSTSTIIYTYNEKGEKTGEKIIDYINGTITEKQFEGTGGSEEETSAVQKDSKGNELWDYTVNNETGEVIINYPSLNMQEIRKYISNDVYESSELKDENGQTTKKTYYDENGKWTQIDYYENGEVIDTQKAIITATNAKGQELQLENIENSTVEGIVKEALSYSVNRDDAGSGNLPYVWGGTSLETGADCSGFVQTLYGKRGYELARQADDQVKNGRHVDLNTESIKPGDLIFCSYGSDSIEHVAMYVGEINNVPMIVHENTSSTGCITETYDFLKQNYNIFDTRRIVE